MEPLLLEATLAGAAMLIPVEATVALLPQLAEWDKLVLLLKLFDMRDGKEENEGPEAIKPLF